eukprot:3862465-Amphidinium_carterae.1
MKCGDSLLPRDDSVHVMTLVAMSLRCGCSSICLALQELLAHVATSGFREHVVSSVCVTAMGPKKGVSKASSSTLTPAKRKAPESAIEVVHAALRSSIKAPQRRADLSIANA